MGQPVLTDKKSALLFLPTPLPQPFSPGQESAKKPAQPISTLCSLKRGRLPMGIGFKFTGLPTGVTLSASRPQLEQLPYATSFTDSTRSGEALTLRS
jgi:hypothetical protein